MIEKQDPTSANGYYWYRLYDDGWVEQGRNNILGNNTWTQQTFPIQMADKDNYTWAVGYDYGATVNVQYRQASLIYRATTGLQIVEDNDIYKSWRIEGMSARGATQQTRYIIKF